MKDRVKVKIINLAGIKRVVQGKLIDDLDIDYSQDLDDLKIDLKIALDVWVEVNQTKISGYLKTAFKNIQVYQGNNHLDVIDNGVGSLNWLTIRDHII